MTQELNSMLLLGSHYILLRVVVVCKSGNKSWTEVNRPLPTCTAHTCLHVHYQICKNKLEHLHSIPFSICCTCTLTFWVLYFKHLHVTKLVSLLLLLLWSLSLL